MRASGCEEIPGDCGCTPCAQARAAGATGEGAVRRCAVRGVIVAAVGAAVLAGPGTAAAGPPDAAPSRAARPEEPGVVPADGGPEAPGAAPAGESAPADGGAVAVLPEEPARPAAAESAGGRPEGVTPAGPLEPAVAYALAHRGDPYALGGTGPHRWDCSGLVQQAYRRVGVSLPRVAADQYRATRRIKRGALRRGDLVFWSSDGRASGVHHVAIYLGNGQYLEAAKPGTKVRVSTFAHYSPNLYGRVDPPDDSCDEDDDDGCD
ncbi:C40 family peptidase [Streptomyces sp. NPDC052396]|uniref:C40 family peptidase n=1 Tax=Streptomyces sp. NPDC052396 TaxID=3365689 RepID=UPI0037D68A44